jgi:hypothetical protein
MQVPVEKEILSNIGIISTLPTGILLNPTLFNQNLPLPVVNTQSGNLFNDRFNPNLRWYLPKYDLAADIDTLFSFAASQSGVDSTGHPFNKGMLTLGLHKSVPDDVQAFQSSDPNFQYQEIPSSNLVASLSTTFTDPNTGQIGNNNYTGQISNAPNGDLQLTFDNIIGPGLIILYNNLQQKGAGILVSFNYDAWLQTGPIRIIFIPIRPRPVLEHPVVMRPPVTAMRQAVQTSPTAPVTVHPIAPVTTAPPVTMRPLPPDPPVIMRPLPPVTTPQPATYQRTTMTASFQLSLDNKYIINAYTLKFTIGNDSGVTRPIINQNDLTGFNQPQSEFTELEVFGDIRQKYPSISRLYQGVISRTIMVIPVSYTIVRSTTGLSALCQAVVDSGSGSNDINEFDFTFTLAPDVSPIDMMQLSQDISKNAQLQAYSITLPSFLKEGSTPQLMSLFQSSTQGFNTEQQYFFALGIGIKDQTDNSPAVAAANILLGQLCQDQQPFLLATLSLKLDDNFADPVLANAVLNFHQSKGTDDLTVSVDNNSKTITFLNSSPFDLKISRYALCDDSGVNVVPANLAIKSGQSAPVPFSSSTGTLNIIADSDIDAAGPISKADIEKFITFQTQDVQLTKFTFGVNAASVNFDTLGISQIDVLVSVTDAANISVPQFSLVKLHSVDSSSALVPIQNAITSLLANVLFTVHFTDTSKTNTTVNIQHQFIDNPILILQDQDIPT